MPRDVLKADELRSGVSAQEIVDIAISNIGIDWTVNGCTDFVWGVSNLAGAPFFDLKDNTIGGDPAQPQDIAYVVPHSPGIKSGTDDVSGDGWTSVFSGTSASAMTAALRPGDVVRVYTVGNAAEDSLLPSGGYGAHSFVVTSVTEAGVEVVDNWNTAGIVRHSLDDITAAFAPGGQFGAAFVSRLDEAYVNETFPEDINGNGFGSFAEFAVTDLTREIDSVSKVPQKVGSEFLVNNETFSTQSGSTLVALSDGGFVAAWVTADSSQDGSDFAIKARSFDADGIPRGAEFLINSEAQDRQQEPVLTALPDGGFMVAWYTVFDPLFGISNNAISARSFNADGTPRGAEFLVNTETAGGGSRPALTTLTDGGFVVAWETTDQAQDGSGWAIKARSFDASGTPRGAEFLVNSETFQHQTASTITSLPDGGFVAAWATYDPAQDGNSDAIKARSFDADGTPRGAEFLVNTETFSAQITPVLTTLFDGTFVVAWGTLDPAQDGSQNAIKARIFDADGTPRGAEFLVNIEAAGTQWRPTLAPLPDGGFVAAWGTTDEMQDGSGTAVKARSFDSDGTPRGAEFLVNTETLFDQRLPALTTLSNGDIVVAWDTRDGTQDGSGPAIKAQIFSVSSDGTNAPPVASGDTLQTYSTLDSIPLANLFALTDPDGADDIVSIEISDDTPGTDGGEFGRYVFQVVSGTAGWAWFPEPRIPGEPYQLTLTSAQLDDRSGPFGDYAWQYLPKTTGTNAIQIEAIDSAGNVSDPFVVSLSFTAGLPDLTAFDWDLSGVDAQGNTFEGDLVFELQEPLTDGFTLGGYFDWVANGTIEFRILFDGLLEDDGDIFFTSTELANPVSGVIAADYFAEFNTDFTQLIGTSGGNGIITQNWQADRVTSTPGNTAPTITSPRLFEINQGALIVADLSANDDRDSEGNGLTYSLGSTDDGIFFSTNTVTGELQFSQSGGISLTGDADGDGIYELIAQVTDRDGLTDEQPFQVRVLKNASSASLEYIAKQIAYDRSPANIVVLDTLSPEQAALRIDITGWEEEYEFIDVGGTFRAVALSKEGHAPVLAFRGTKTDSGFADGALADWAENFRPTGVGLDELNRGLDVIGAPGLRADDEPAPTLREWILANDGLSITGHSQGGAQAQLATRFALTNDVQVAKLATFNSAGITLTQPLIDDLEIPFFDTPVVHSINASDIVSLTGNAFVPGVVEYHDTNVPNVLIVIPNIFKGHTGYFVNEGLRSLLPFFAAPFSRSNLFLSDDQLSSNLYSPALGFYGQDWEYAGFMTSVLALGNMIASAIAINPGAIRVSIGTTADPTPIIDLHASGTSLGAFLATDLFSALATRGGLVKELAGENGDLVRNLLRSRQPGHRCDRRWSKRHDQRSGRSLRCSAGHPQRSRQSRS